MQAMREKALPSCVFAMQTKDTKIKAGICVYRLQDEIAQKILQHGFMQGIIIAGFRNSVDMEVGQ